MSDRVRLEGAAESPLGTTKRSAIYDYLSAVVHDLRNPLGAAIGNLSFVRDSLASEQSDLAEAIDDAGDAVRRVETLVDELVSVAQFEAGTLRLRPEAVDLSESVRMAVEMAQREAALRSVEVRATTLPPLVIHADRALVRRVIESLIWCGFKATPARGVIELRSERAADGSGHLLVACTGTVDPVSNSAPAVYFARAIIAAHRGSLTFGAEPPFATVMRLAWPPS